MPLMSEYRDRKWCDIPKHPTACIHCGEIVGYGEDHTIRHGSGRRINIGGRYWSENDALLRCQCGEETPVYTYTRWSSRSKEDIPF